MRALCKCCGTPWRISLGWLDTFQQEQVENLYQIWGDATILRALYVKPPSMLGHKGFSDPVWERDWENLRSGREGYPDDTPGYAKTEMIGKKHLFKLVHLLMDQIAQEAGIYSA